MQENIDVTGAAYRAIVGLLKIDKIVIAIRWSKRTHEIWELHGNQVFDAIRGLLGNVDKNHDGYCDTDPWFRRRRVFSNDAHRIEIFYKRQPLKIVEETVRSPYQGYIRVTNPDVVNGHANHVAIAMGLETVLDQFGIRHFLGTGRECCELALDFPSYEAWQFVDERLLWKWTGPHDHKYYDKATGEVLPGFDPLKSAGAESHYVKRPDEKKNKARRFFHGYVEPNMGKYRQEMRLNRDFLKAHGIETVSDLVDKGTGLVETHLSLWEPDIDKILRQRRKYERKRTCSDFYRRTPDYYRNLVDLCSAAEVLNDLSQKLKHISPYEIKEKCFKRVPGPRIEQAPFKRYPTIPRTESPQDNSTIEHHEGNTGPNPPIFMHEITPQDIPRVSLPPPAITPSTQTDRQPTFTTEIHSPENTGALIETVPRTSLSRPPGLQKSLGEKALVKGPIPHQYTPP